jgi:hypothetical protein
VITSVLSAPLMAADLNITVEIPRLSVAEYHRPYVAMWIERPDQSVAANLAVWYDIQPKSKEDGTTWLKDMRTWWRRSGRELKMPVDGVSGATRPPGTHQLTFSGAKPPMASLAPGSYHVVVEAAREVGGRELLRVPFEWPVKSPQIQKAKGEHELGAITVSLKP